VVGLLLTGFVGLPEARWFLAPAGVYLAASADFTVAPRSIGGSCCPSLPNAVGSTAQPFAWACMVLHRPVEIAAAHPWRHRTIAGPISFFFSVG
jgi:hypothetical protein